MEWYHIGVQSTGSEGAYDDDDGVVSCGGKALVLAHVLSFRCITIAHWLPLSCTVLISSSILSTGWYVGLVYHPFGRYAEQ